MKEENPDPAKQAPERRAARRIHVAWLTLLIATLLSWWLAEGHHPDGIGLAATCVVMALSGIKGLIIALDFMELRHAPRLWRNGLLCWLAVILLVIFLATLWHDHLL